MREVILNDFNIIFFYLSITYFCNGGQSIWERKSIYWITGLKKETAYIELLD